MSITCVLIENRELSIIREIIFDNHLKFLPKGSNVIFFHSKNYEYIKNNLIGLPIIFINLDEILINYETNHQVYINKLERENLDQKFYLDFMQIDNTAAEIMQLHAS